MSDRGEPSSENLASHTLAYLRRHDERMDSLERTMIQVVDSLRQVSTKIDRSDRDNKEAFARIERDLHEIRSDAIVSESKILDRYSETLDLSRRLNRHDERLDAIENTLFSNS